MVNRDCRYSYIKTLSLLVLSLVSLGALTARANTLEDEINKSQDLVLLSEVSYGGTPFVAVKSIEGYDSYAAEARATLVCQYLGHGISVYHVTHKADPKTIKFWEVTTWDGSPNVYKMSIFNEPFPYGNGTQIFSMIACRKKSAGQKRIAALDTTEEARSSKHAPTAARDTRGDAVDVRGDATRARMF